MSEQEAAVQASNPGFWSGIGLAIGTGTTFVAKYLWDGRKRPRQATHADFMELRGLLEELRQGQEERAKQMAVIEATVATKEDLSKAVENMADRARLMVDAVHNRVSEHLRDHSKAA